MSRTPRHGSSLALVGLLAVLASCAGEQVEPDTPQGQGGPRPASDRTREPSAGPAEEIAEVREFRQSIADRQELVKRTQEASVGPALVSVAESFYQEHSATLQQAFEASLADLEDGSPPDPARARMVGSVDAATAEENGERRRLAQFHLVFAPDVSKQASNAFSAAFVPLAAAQVEMPVSEAGELYGFFSVAEPSYTRCGENDVCIHYGESDTFVVNFTRLEEGLWTPAGVTWWTTVPPAPPEEGIGRRMLPADPEATAAGSKDSPAEAPRPEPPKVPAAPPTR